MILISSRVLPLLQHNHPSSIGRFSRVKPRAETARGWRIAKDKQALKIDVVIALAMAALAAIRGQAEPYYDIEALI
jgi:hypothetical protein